MVRFIICPVYVWPLQIVRMAITRAIPEHPSSLVKQVKKKKKGRQKKKKKILERTGREKKKSQIEY